MSDRLQSLFQSVVPIVADIHRCGRPELIGAGIVITPTAVITCRHVIDELHDSESAQASRLRFYGALCGSRTIRPSYASASNSWDCCVLRFDSLPGMKPAPLTRLARLVNLQVATIGFAQEERITQRRVPDLRVVQEELGGGWVQAAQIGSGIPAGFSGSPVLVEDKKSWRVVGQLSLGEETALVSRMIGMDPIASFLSQIGIKPLVSDLPIRRRPVATQQAGKAQSVVAGGHIKGTIVKMTTQRGAQRVKAGGSIVGCDIDQKRTDG